MNLTPGVILSRRTTTGGLDPKTGYSISFDNRFGTKAVTDANFFRSELVIKGVFSPTERTRVLYKLMQGGIFGSDANKVPPSMRFFVGGEQTLRGFGYKTQSSRRLGYLTGSRYLTAGTLEYMFPVGIENSRGAVFLDSAICTNSYSKINRYSTDQVSALDICQSTEPSKSILPMALITKMTIDSLSFICHSALSSNRKR